MTPERAPRNRKVRTAPKTEEVRCKLSVADCERLDELCLRLELNRSEVLRFYIRQAYEALGQRCPTAQSSQLSLFTTTLPDGKTPVPVPIPAVPPQKQPATSPAERSNEP